MKTLKFLIILLLLPVTVLAQTYYSIQISARKSLKDAVKILKQVENYQDARIDKVDGFFKVRVGLFETYKDARSYLLTSGIKKQFKDAFISKVTDKVLENSIFPPELIEQQEPVKKEPIEKETKPKEKTNYSITILKTKSIEEAAKFFINLPETVKKHAFIYKDNNKTYSVRLFIEPGKEKITERLSQIKQYHFETKIEPTDKKNIVNIKIKSSSKTDKNQISEKEERKSNKKAEVEKAKKTQKQTEKKGKSYSPITVLIAGIVVITAIVIIIKRGKNSETSEAKDMYHILEEALKKGNTSLVKEIVVPYLSRFPEDIKAQEFYAMALEKEGRYMEAADIYFTIAEVLEGKQQFEDAMRYKKKAEELVNKEFNKKRKQ
ncbi:SPOR domain-containing protein [Desulfurobacterium atlanticum]|uniref:Sporulation related domain-containing protein n=1 Tax=Desulfurobacterium atlanticum TaxID=240169 RepID=A0A238ZUG8_9BACT|nr:SPOR domain-containing protein [Desulfurobacterium atlanticum]SNR86414.1 Sporulation related domain-containing protein [Desulfurobacterium atlanticum]